MPSVVASDTRNPTEFVSVTSVPPIRVNVSSPRIATDSVTVRRGAPVVSVIDTLVKTESVRLLMGKLFINVSDTDHATERIRFPITVDPPPATPVSEDGTANCYALTWLVDCRQVTGTGLTAADLMYADLDVEVLDPPYQARLIGNPTVNRELMDTFWGITEVSEINMELANADGQLTPFYEADPRHQTIILRRLDYRTGEIIDELYARITSVALGVGTLIITASSPDLSVFEREIPNALVTTDTYPKAVDIGRTVPVVFGDVTKLPLPFINNDLGAATFDYMIGFGALTVTAVYFVRTDVGYTQIPTQEYTVSTSLYPGFTVLRFTKPQIDANNRNLVLCADVSGASRNFARAIQDVLSVTAWGLNETVDTAAFDAAAGDLDQVGLFCDGAMTEQRQAQDVLRDLLVVRGMRLAFTSDGKWTITVDKVRTTAKLQLYDGVGDGPRTILQAGARRRPLVSDAISIYKLQYRVDFIRGGFLFDQKRTVHPTFGREKTIDNVFVRDHTTADKIIDYLAKREKFGSERVDMTIPQEGRLLLEGDLVEVTYDPFDLLQELMEIRKVSKKLETVAVELASWSDEIFIYGPGTLPTDGDEFTGPFILPRPGGFELVGLFLDDEFIGCDIILDWHAISQIYIGQDDEDNLVNQERRDYQLEVFVDEVLKRVAYSFVETFTYTIDMNRADTPPAGSRTVKFVLRGRTHAGQLGNPNSIIVTKPVKDLAV